MGNARNFKGYDGIFAERFRAVMDVTKTTQDMLEKQIGVKRQSISTYMDGSVMPNVETLHKICSYFDLPSDYLLGFTNSKSRDISDQQIQDKTGLSYEAIKNLEEIYRGSPPQLFAMPFDIGVINYMLSDKDRIRKYLSIISKYFGKKATDMKTDFSLYSYVKYMEQLLDSCYNDFYLPYRNGKAQKKKPGRKRKIAESNPNNENE